MNNRRWDQLQGGEIIAMRKERGLTQAQLAELLGVRQATVSDWEHGKVIPSRLAVLALRYWWSRSNFLRSSLPPQV